MVVNFSAINMKDQPTLILKNAGGTPLGVLSYATNISLDVKYNEISVLEFKLPAYVDGVAIPYYDDLVGMRIVEFDGIGQFSLTNPVETGDGVKKVKQCKANSLEYEFSYKKITIPNDTYKFYDLSNPENTILGMILELMPAWSVGTIDQSVWNKYRTFEETNENVYNFIKGAVQESYNCIFDFDTIHRLIHVRDISQPSVRKPVFISSENLAKEIEIEENTEDVFTRLDVSGAEGVDIRDVNPTGTNKIIMLDYFMNEKNFDSALITKYNAWKALVESNRTDYYNLNIQYTLAIMEKATEDAKLADLNGELTGLENELAVAIQAVAGGLQPQSAIDTANQNIANKKTAISAQKTRIASIDTKIATIKEDLQDIVDACSFEDYFTSGELLQLDKYIRDGEITESSFVSATVSSYADDGVSSDLTSAQFALSGADVTEASTASSMLYDCRGGGISIGQLHADCISLVCDKNSNGDIVITAYLNAGTIGATSFSTGCLSITGSSSSFTATETGISCAVTGHMYFTLNASEYERRSISWELYEYGLSVARRLAYPSYTFSIDSANFFALDDFEYFKNNIELGQNVYAQINDGTVLEPIFVGAHLDFDALDKLELQFSDSYVSGDSEFRLVDLLNKSVSMGKNVDVSRYIYSSFVDTGASTGIKDFMTSALDTSKNAILSSTNQAISWDGAGLRLRKYANQAHTAFDNEQVWMSNNSIMMTDDGWATAKMAIGKFRDANAGNVWGIVAPAIVGTILAGENLIIESAKKDGTTAVFRVDEDGCRLYNSDFEIVKTVGNVTSQVAIDPDFGLAIGIYPLYTTDQYGIKTLNTNNAKLYADSNGNLHLSGVISATGGEIGGWNIGNNSLSSGTGAGYVALNSDTSGTYAIWAGDATAADAPFSVTRAGALKATTGNIGGWSLVNETVNGVTTKRLNSGIHSSYVALDSGSTGMDYVIWAGADYPGDAPSGASSEITDNAPFRVMRDGTVYLTKLKALGEPDSHGDRPVVDVNLGSYPFWKLNYSTVKSITAANNTLTITTTGGTTVVNFKTAASFALSGGWSNGAFVVDMTDLVGTTVYQSSSSGQITRNMTDAEIKAAIEGNTHMAQLLVEDPSFEETLVTANIDASGVYAAGIRAGSPASATGYADTVVGTRYSTGSVSIRAANGTITTLNNVSIHTGAAYDAGEVAGEAKFTLASVTLQGSAQTVYEESASGTNYYQAASPVTYYKGDGGSFTVEGTEHEAITPVGTAVHFRVHPRTDTPTGYWYELVSSGGTTYYNVGTQITGLRNPGTTTKVARGSQVAATPIDLTSQKTLASVTRYTAGSVVTDTYYTKL